MKIIVSFLLLFALSLSAQPKHIIFTYMGDPSTTVTANWQCLDILDLPNDAAENTATVYYDTVPRNGEIEAYAYQQIGRVFQIEGLNDRTIARVQLEGLEANTVYYMLLGDPVSGYSEELSVKTIPDDKTPIRFVTGGDMGPSEDTRTLLRNAATHDPDFAAVGGDIAYANGKLDSVDRWDTWLDYYTEEMLTSDGRSIPVVFAIGNHEVAGGFNKSNTEAPFFFNFFGQDTEKSYFSRQFGSNFVLLALDSGHVNTHESQVDWISETLTEHQSTKYTAAFYHVPLYPSHRDFMGYFSDQGRTHWAPIFDEYALTVAFENHDHTYKRSHLLHGHEPTEDRSGTLYLGDGCWGVGVRPIDYEQRPYLRQSGSIQHFWVVDVDSEALSYRAVDLENRVFDVYPENNDGYAAAAKVFASIEQTYKLPDGVVEVLDIEGAQEPWHRGGSAIIIENTFDEPISVSFKVRQAKNLNVTGLPTDGIGVAPGVKRVVPIEVFTSKIEGILLEQFKAVIAANVAIKKPNGEITARLVGNLTIKLKAKAEAPAQ